MCYQIAYTLQCEHVLTDIIYCSDATVEPGASVGNNGDPGIGSSSGSSKSHSSIHSKHKASSSSSKSKGQHSQQKASSSGSSSLSSKQHHHHRRHNQNQSSSSSDMMPPPPLPSKQHKRPCANLSVQSMPYPTPPSFATDPVSFYSSSPLSPRCPLRDECPFEQKQRCWNCCWCGKGWNMTGRCGCVMLIEGNQVRCEHICCEQCEPAAASAGSGTGAYGGPPPGGSGANSSAEEGRYHYYQGSSAGGGSYY
ncbi:hypothetical protein B0H66DRAFT_530227 [Apodospora peruviana]|uniref:Uncharacterized protein n=1 Tax=Apodospora peruviana TaxID=516989 RepID=A0AAE0IJU1_9PEZI|nr:hypothetical protein B0H66DRAFT_530227 [Apodospora peruviana]